MNIRQVPSPNFYDLTDNPHILVLHTTLGAFNGAVEHLTSTKTGVSAHYVFGRNEGEIAQLVTLDKGAWHAGVISNPSARGKKAMKRDAFWNFQNPNKYSIGFEFAAGYDIDRDGILESWEQAYTTAQIRNSVKVLVDVIEPALGYTFQNPNILIHKDITSYKPELEAQRTLFIAELGRYRIEKILLENLLPEKIDEVKAKKPSSLKEDFAELRTLVDKIITTHG